MRSLITRSLTLQYHFSPPLRHQILFLGFSTGDNGGFRQRSDLHHSHGGASMSTRSDAYRRHHHYEEENSRSVKVKVWWDFENCNIPNGVNVFRVAQRITSALRSTGIKGPVTINAFGDVVQLSRTTQEALTSTGVCLTHVPHGGKNSSDRFFMADLVYWVSQNPPPVHFFLISGDRDFANILHRLRMSNYNILLASTDTAAGVLCSAATVMWPWNALVRGEDMATKHFNHPPDGLYGSWYGHYKGVVDDPFPDVEQQANWQAEETMELASEIKPRAIPKAVVNGIRHILYSYPEGINMSELRAELKRNNLTMDKDFFGHKKFSNLLSTLPGILKFIPHPSGDGQPLVIGTQRKVSEPVEASSKPATESEVSKNEKNRTQIQSSKSSSLAPSKIVADPSPRPTETSDATSGSSSTSPQESFLASKEPKVATKDSVSPSRQGRDFAVDEEFWRKIWRTLIGPRDQESNEQGAAAANGGGSNSGKGLASSLGKAVWLTADSSDPKSSGSNSSDADKLCDESKTIEKSNNEVDGPNMKTGFFSWWRFWKSGAELKEGNGSSVKEVVKHEQSDSPEESLEASDRKQNQSKSHDLFSRSYFWNALESFLLTSKGSEIILKSRTREQLMHELQKEGPWVLKDLKEVHLVQFVELLISQKKWVEEAASQIFPFKLALPIKRCSSAHAHGANGLSSLFADRLCQPNLHNLMEQDKVGASSGTVSTAHKESMDVKPAQNATVYNNGKKKRPSKREDILIDCQKLCQELLKKNPDGFNMSIFRPWFLQRYGYVLDHQTLGYPKLVSLLQIMPGVRLESSFVLPAGKIDTNSVREKVPMDETASHRLEDDRGEFISTDADGQANGEDSVWEELGPVSEAGIQEGMFREEKGKHVGFDVASLSDEDFTDSEDDVPHCPKPEERRKRGEEDSSLLQILDSWYSSKESEKDQVDSIDGLVDCSKNATQDPSDQKPPGSLKPKAKPHRTYSFVSDAGDEKEKLVESILGSLKKVGETKFYS